MNYAQELAINVFFNIMTILKPKSYYKLNFNCIVFMHSIFEQNVHYKNDDLDYF